MLGTLVLIIGMSTLFFTVILTLLGVGIVAIGLFVIIFNVAQWLLGPYLIQFMCHVRPAQRSDYPKQFEMVTKISQKAGIKEPKLMIANMPAPNAFAYGSPLTGNRVALTTGLLNELNDEEVEAVLGHELGHLKHRDVQLMMFVSVLPSLAYFIGYSLVLSSMFGGTTARNKKQSGGTTAAIGAICILIYFILTLFVLELSRLREYYADRHSVSVVEDGSRKLSEGLAKIVSYSARMRNNRQQSKNMHSFKSLFITDPDRAVSDAAEVAQMRGYASPQMLVQEIMARKITTTDKITEALSTHPNIVKRLRAILEA